MSSAKLPSADHQLLEAIARDPGHVLMYYARPGGMSQKLALITVEHLIARGAVKRNTHTEQLTVVGDKPQALDVKVPMSDVPSFTAVRYPGQEELLVSDLQSQILSLLDAGDKTTREIAELTGKNAAGLGKTLHALRVRGLITSSGPLGNKIWHLGNAASVVDAVPLVANSVECQIPQNLHTENASPVLDQSPAKPNKAELMRKLLRSGGEYTSTQLAAAAGVEVSKVRPLLQNDIQKGRVESVRSHQGRVTYRLLDAHRFHSVNPENRLRKHLDSFNDEIVVLKTELQRVTAQRDHFKAMLCKMRTVLDAEVGTV